MVIFFLPSTALGIVDQLVGTGTVDQIHVPLLEAHTQAITDFQFNPFNDDVVATTSADHTIKIWKLDQLALRDRSELAVRESSLTIRVLEKARPAFLRFHPCASNLLMASCGLPGDNFENCVNLYDIGAEKKEPLLQIKRPKVDPPHSVSWSFDGTTLVLIDSHRRLVCIDPRGKDASLSSEDDTHENHNKPAKLLPMSQMDRCLTIGYGYSGLREVAFWDLRNPRHFVSCTPIDREPVPSAFASILDVESNFLFVSTRGERDISVWKANPESAVLSPVTTFRSMGIGSTHALCMMPKSVCDFGSGELVRMARISNNQIEMVRFQLRRSTNLTPRGAGMVSEMSMSTELRKSTSGTGTTVSADPSFLTLGDLDVVSVAAEIFPETLVPQATITAAEWIFLKQNGWPKTAPLSAGGKVAIDLARLIGSQEFSDCTIRLSGEDTAPIYAHKCILSVRCRVLHEMLLESSARGSDEIFLDTTRSAIDAVLLFLYTDSVLHFRFTAAAKDVISLARRLDLPSMVSMLLRQPAIQLLNLGEPPSSAVTTGFLRDMARLVDDGRTHFSDLVISSTDCSFPTHRCILAMRSAFFYRMLTSGFQEQTEGRIKLENLEEADLRAVLASVYTGRPGAYVNSENVMELWLVATQHELPELAKTCERYIQESVDVENAVALFVRAEMINSSPALRKFLLNYMTSFWDSISASPENIKDLDPKYIQIIQDRRPVKATRLKMFGRK